MSKPNQNISVAKKGMNRDTHPSNLSETEYTFALNTNYEDESGNGYPFLQNEQSNLLCSTFKPGYKVIGFKHDLNEDRTFYFLTNPTTKVSEIGYISGIQNVNSVEDVDKNCGCDIIKVLGEPLENQQQTATCQYFTIISDECNNCLNFSINKPIRKNNIQIKDEKCGKRLYWTDGFNPPRYLDLTNLEQYGHIGEIVCGEDNREETCLDCDKLRIFPLFEKPCITPVSIQYGGSLKAGVYEFLIAYCDREGNEITQYYSITNPISIFDENNNVLDQTELAYVTNFGIRLDVSHLDEKFGYYKVAVIQRADVNAATSYFIEGVHPISDKSVVYYSDGEKQRTTLNHILAVKPSYLTSEMMTTSNGYLFQAGLKAEKEFNLQPVVNLMGAFLRWQTVKSDENLYKDGVNTSLYKGYMRDEVYPFSIRFYSNDGYETSNFTLINRPPNNTDLEIVNNKDTESVISFVPNCAESGRIHRWQYYNTSSVLGDFCTQENTNVDLSCTPINHQYGKFGYWESVEEYPDNNDLYNSKRLRFFASTIPTKIKSEFESYFVESLAEDRYILKDETDFRCKPIKHYRFPDSCVAPFMSTESNGVFQNSYIYPIGVTIDEEIISYFLDMAVVNKLITEEQRNKIDKYEIFRGDRALHKGIVAKGLAYDMYKYDESENDKDIYYSNYPYNDLGEDDLHYTNKDRDSLIQHPYQGNSNNKFTFHSPDTHFRKPTIPTEIKVEGFQLGNSKGVFSAVEGHSKWVILTNEAYVKATTLATVECIAELAIKYGDFQVQNAIAGDRVYDEREYGKVERAIKTKDDYDLTEEGKYGNMSGQVAGALTAIEGTWQTTPGQGSTRGTVDTTGNQNDNFDHHGDEPAINQGTKSQPLTGWISQDPTVNRGSDANGWHGTKGTDVNVDKITLAERIFTLYNIFNQAFNKLGEYRYEWLKIFKDNGQPENFAFYYTSEGWYNYEMCNNSEGNMIRGLSAKKYLKSGRYKVNEIGGDKALKINNTHRESSLFLSTGGFNLNYPDLYKNFDNSRFESSDIGNGEIDLDLGITDESGNPLQNFTYDNKSPEVTAQIASPYISLRNYVPNQYGNIDSIKWIPTGFCGEINTTNQCSNIFGGDIFISRFSLKRKIPLFLTTAIGLADLTPFNYYPDRNIGHPVYYADYDVTEMNMLAEMSSGNPTWQIIFTLLGIGWLNQPLPQFKSYYKFDNFVERGLYVRPPSKFYLYYYGIPQFLVESEINCNYRYGKKELHENFFPNVGDYVDWTQEKTVSIKNDNHFYYNNTYSKNTTMVGTRMLPSNYDKKLYNCLYDAPNGVIYSMQDISEQDVTDPWLIYKPLDFYQFPTSSGKLIDILDIESSQIIGRFEHQLILFNAIDQLRDRLAPENQELGTGGIFASRPLEFKKTDLGYAGTQHKEIVSCEFGHFWADAKRGQVFQVDQNGRDLKEITSGLRNWFKEHLPFKILKYNIEGLTSNDLDNNYKGIGLAMGWDSRFKRVFLTKRDYIPKHECIKYDPEIGFYLDGECMGEEPIISCEDGYTYNPTTQMCELSYYTEPCPEGWEYNPITNTCEIVETTTPIVEEEIITTITCPEGYIYDADLQMCVRNEVTPLQCPEDHTYNPVSGMCERIETVPLSCPSGYTYNPTTQMCEIEECVTDIIFVLDTSGSMTPTEFSQMQEFFISVVDELEDQIITGDIRIGVIRFSNGVNNESGFSNSITIIKNAINAPQIIGGTNIIAALCRTETMLATARPEATKQVVLYTDGYQNFDPGNTCPYTGGFIYGGRSIAYRIKYNIGAKFLMVYAGDEQERFDVRSIYVDPSNPYTDVEPIPSEGNGVYGRMAWEAGFDELPSILDNLLEGLECQTSVNPICESGCEQVEDECECESIEEPFCESGCEQVEDHCECYDEQEPTIEQEIIYHYTCPNGWIFNEDDLTCERVTSQQGCSDDCIYENELCNCIEQIDPIVEYIQTPIDFTDEYFEDVSFTLAYSPITQTWISYYSFKPNYYVSYHNYFQTGLNYSNNNSELGLWSHLLTNKSYQVFYGKKYDWTIELPNKESYVNKILTSIEYWLDTRRYHNEYDFAEHRNRGFNNVSIYNNSNHTGKLNLITEEKNNRFQKTQYPKVNLKNSSTDILVTQNDKKWTFNHFFNRVRNELNNQPLWYYDKNQIEKTLNKDAFTYNQKWLDRFRGDWNLVRLTQNKESRFKFIFKWLNTKELIYN